MTTERQPAEQVLDAPAPALDQFEITDDTTPEQRALEAQMLAEPDEGEPSGEAPEAASEAPAETPPVSQTPAPVEPPKAETPAPQQRTFSQEEVSKMQSAWMRQIETEKKSAREANDKLQRFNLDAQVEALLRRQEQSLAAQYGEDDARKIVRSPDNMALVREREEFRHDKEVAETRAKAEGEQAEQNAKLMTAQLLMQRHSLDADDFELLINAGPPDSMVKLARRLSNQQKAAAEQAKRSLVPPETAATKPETGASPGSGPMNHDQMLARVRQKPSWEWTDKEREFMRTGRV